MDRAVDSRLKTQTHLSPKYPKNQRDEVRVMMKVPIVTERSRGRLFSKTIITWSKLYLNGTETPADQSVSDDRSSHPSSLSYLVYALTLNL